ncbi:MAG: acyltransferase family protein [Acidimicrobiales bacterium]
MATSTRAVRTRRADGASGAAPLRSDIQGLRALAVVAVLVYHLWPHRLTGGYVGVDVFFVISGFLITGHLLRTPVDGPGALLGFWARRVRRLIPAATVVLLATLAASLVWLPVTVRSAMAREVVASALYVQNWVLASSATDYLAAEAQPTPVQHYWSLSIEEQFYLVWPVVIWLVVWAASRVRPGAWLPAAVIAAVVAASLWWSATLTATDPSRAYFVTTTRIWELAAGGLLAAVAGAGATRLAPGLRAALAWGGLGLIGWSMVTYDQTTAFPGTAALVPVLGTLAVLAASADGVRGGPGRVLVARPVAWTGHVSYSLYLWHWPLIVITPFAVGADLVAWQSWLVAVAAVVLAGLSTRFVETPLRRHPRGARLAPTFAALGVCLAVVTLAGSVVVVSSERQARADEERAVALLDDPPDCLGAAAVRDPACGGRDVGILTPATFARDDRPVVYADGCWNNSPFTGRRTCTYGPDQASVRVALVGNSHAGHWQPAILAAMEGRDWSLTTFLASECYTVDVPVDMGTGEATDNCERWNEWAVEEIASGDFDLVIMSNRTFRPLVGVDGDQRGDVARDSYGRVLDTLTATGSQVVVLRDTPDAGRSIPDCVARFLHDPRRCATDLAEGLERDPLAEAGMSAGRDGVQVVDVTHLVCPDGVTCPAILGGVLVYFDHGHMTATFATTLVPEVEAAMSSALDD